MRRDTEDKIEKKYDQRRKIFIIISITIILFFLDFAEIKNEVRRLLACEPIPEIILQKFCDNVNNSSLHSAVSFFSLLAIVVAMIQAVYPFLLGKIHDYPIAKINKSPFRDKTFHSLIFFSIIISVTEILHLYTIEVFYVLLGYIIIIHWLYEVMSLFKQYENAEDLFTEKIEDDLYKILKESGQKKLEAEEDLKEIIERIISIDGIEERELIERFTKKLYCADQCFLSYDSVESKRSSIFEYSYYLSSQMAEKCPQTELVECSWHYRMLKDAILEADYENCLGEMFIKGILFGCIATDNNRLAESCMDEILPLLMMRLNTKQLSELISCIFVYLEIYCYENALNDKFEYAVNIMEKFITSGYVQDICNCSQRTKLQLLLEYNGSHMEECYFLLVELRFLHLVEEYEIVQELQREIVLKENTNIPKTIAGTLYAFYNN